jgi:hypothetical protein
MGMDRLLRSAWLPGLAAMAMAAACGSATVARSPGASTGEDLLSAQAFGQAEAFYRQVLQLRPDDAAAVRGLAQARRGWVGKALAQVRTRRLAGQEDGALEDLEGVVRQVRDWEMGVPADTGPDYEAEVAAAAPALDARLQAVTPRPLVALAFLEARKDAFGDGVEGLQRLGARRAAVLQAGARHCEALWSVAAVRSPFFAELAARYCAAFEVQKTIAPALQEARARERFRHADLKVAVAGLEPAESEALGDALDAAVHGTPWFDPKGLASLGVTVRGALVARTTREAEALTHPYALQVPYTALEEYCEWAQVPVTATKWVGGRQVTVTEYRSECRNRTREVQQVRVEPQVLQFQGTRVRQSLRLQVEADATLARRPFRASRQDALDQSDVTHDVSRPDIALAPDPLVLTPRAEWLSGHFAALAADLAARLREGWSSRYCKPADGGLDAAAEQALRCLAADPANPPAFVDEWAKGLFGLGAADLLKALGMVP